MAVTAAKSVMAFRVMTMAVDLCRLTTRTMNVNAGHERTSKARIIHQIQLIRGITQTEVICSPQNNTGAPMKKRNFSAEFKRESAQLVVDQNYTVADAAKAMDVGLSTMTRWVKQLRDERQGKTPKASPITPEQIEIRELRKKLQRIEMENEILKKATALLMSDSLNSSR
ncbi:Transposase [Shigella dysenteriae 1617]|nr:Transposase [Shigella dysenteriae 1617]